MNAKNVFYYTLSFIVFATFVIGYLHYREEKRLKKERKSKMDAYYLETMESIYFDAGTAINDDCRKCCNDSMGKTISNALNDGYDHYEIDLIRSHALHRYFDRINENNQLGQ